MHSPHALEHNPDTILCQEAQGFIKTTKNSIHHLLTSSSTMTADTVDQLIQQQTDLKTRKTKLINEKNKSSASFSHAETVIQAYPTRAGHTTEAINTTDASLPAHGSKVIHEMKGKHDAATEVYERSIERKPYLIGHIKDIDKLIQEVDTYISQYELMIGFAGACNYDTPIPLTLSYDYGTETSISGCMFHGPHIPEDISYHLIDSKHKYISGPLRITARDTKTGNNVAIDIHFPQPLAETFSREDIKITYAESNETVSESVFPLQFDLPIEASIAISDKVSTSGKKTSIHHYRNIPILLSLTIPDHRAKKSLIKEAIHDKGSTLIPYIYEQTFNTTAIREKRIDYAIEKIKDTMSPAFASFRHTHKDLCRKTICDSAKDASLGFDFASYLADQPMIGYIGGYQSYKNHIEKYLDALIQQPLGDPLWVSYIDNESFRASVIGKWSLMDQDISDPANPSNVIKLQALYNRHSATVYGQYRKLGNHGKVFEDTFKDSSEYTAYMTDIGRYGPMAKKVKGGDGKNIPLSLQVNNQNGKFGLSCSIDTGQGTPYTIDSRDIQSISQIHNVIYDRLQSLKDEDPIMTHNIGLLYNNMCTLLLTQCGKTALGGLESKSFHNNNGIQGKLRSHNDNTLSIVGKFPHRTDIVQVDTAVSNFLPTEDIDILAKAIHLTFAETKNRITHEVHTNHIPTGYGSLTTNPLLAAYDREKIEPIQCGPSLRLMPTTYGMTWLRGNPPHQEVLTTDGQWQEYMADHKAQNIGKVKAQTVKDFKNHGEDARHAGVNFIQNARLNLIDHNVGLVNSMVQLFAVKPFKLLKSIAQRPVKRDSDGVKQSLRELGGEVGNFFKQNILQFTGLFSLAGATAKFASNVGTTGYKATKGGIDYVKGTFGATVIDPLRKNEQSMEFLLRNLPTDMLDPAHTNTKTLLHHIMQEQIKQKFTIRNDTIRESQAGLANQTKKVTKLNRRKKKNQTDETKGSNGMLKKDVQRDLSGGFFVRCGKDKRKIVCLIHDRRGKLMAVELKTSRLTSTFENKLGIEQVNHNESAYKHQERLFHEYDSGVVSTDLIQERITEHHKSPGTSPIRNWCEIPPAGETWSSGTLQTIFDDVGVWSDFQHITDTGEGHRIAPFGAMTPNHPEPPYGNPFNLPIDLRANAITTPVLNPPTLPSDRNIMKPSSLPPSLSDHGLDDEKPTSNIKEKINHRTHTPQQIDISIVIDKSGSMNGGRDKAQTNGLVDIMNDIHTQGIGGVQKDKISTEIRSGFKELLRKKSNVFEAIEAQNFADMIDRTKGGGGDGIDQSLKEINRLFDRETADYKQKVKDRDIMRIVYVTTDGGINARQEINALRSKGIHVHGIGIEVEEDEIQQQFGKDGPFGGGYCEADLSRLGEKMREVVQDSLVEEQTRIYEESYSPYNRQNKVSMKEHQDKKAGTYNIEIMEHNPQGQLVREKTINKNGGRDGQIVDIQETKEAAINNGSRSVTHICYNPNTGLKSSLSSLWTDSTGIVLDQKQKRDASGSIIEESLIDKRGTPHIEYEKKADSMKHISRGSPITTIYHETKTGGIKNISSVIHNANTNTTTTINYVSNNYRLRSMTGLHHNGDETISAESKTTVNGITTHNTRQVYDASGQCTQRLTIENDTTGRLIAQKEQNRDSSGILINEVVIDNKGPIHHTYTKDATHTRHEKNDTSANIISIYDEQIIGTSKVIEETIDDRTHNRKTTTKQIRDNGQRVSETVEKTVNGMREEYIEQNYDSAGNLMERKRQVSNPNMTEHFDAQTGKYVCYSTLTQASGRQWIREAKGEYNGTEIQLSEYSIIDAITKRSICNTTFIPGSSNIQSFVIREYDGVHGDTFPDHHILMAAIGGEPGTRAIAETIFQSGGIRELVVDKTGKIRRLGLDDSNTTTVPLGDIPFVDSVWIDHSKLPLFLLTPNGDTIAIGPRDLTSDGIYDISQLDEETVPYLNYHNGILSVRP